MSMGRSALENTLADKLVAISVSESPDLGRLGLLERNLQQTVSALTTRLVRHGARIVYGGNLDRTGFTYRLYPAIAQAYATAALRASRPPFVHYIAAYFLDDPAAIAAHIRAVEAFAEVRLVDADRHVTCISGSGRSFVGQGVTGKATLKDDKAVAAFVAALPRPAGGRAADLDAMRAAMEEAVSSRIVIGGRVVGYSGSKPGILQEALLSLKKRHALFPLGGFGGAARDASIVLGLLSNDDALDHHEVGPAYWDTVKEIGEFAGDLRVTAQRSGAWDDIVIAGRADDPEAASNHVMRALVRFASAQ
jgi:SLOG cluster2